MSMTQTPQVRSRAIGKGEAAEHGRLADLRQADEGEIAGEIEAAREAGQVGDGAILP